MSEKSSLIINYKNMNGEIKQKTTENLAEKTLEIITVKDIPVGTIIEATTKSGSQYLFEITNPAEHKAIVTRVSSAGSELETGNRGERDISEVLKVGERIGHGDSLTTEVAKLEIK
jgi:hypothetical protein